MKSNPNQHLRKGRKPTAKKINVEFKVNDKFVDHALDDGGKNGK